MAKYANLVSALRSVRLDVKYAPVVQSVRNTVTVGAKNAPPKPRKSPLSAYQIFVKEKVKNTDYDNENPVDRFKRVAAEWKELNEQDKGIYQERYLMKCHFFIL